jgi:leucyl/phenylalanyl-tRNA--protein transferase
MLRPIWIPPDAPPVFPNPSGFNPEGLIAGGGDLSTARLLAAYRTGLFPWYDEEPILWWCPDPRSVLTMESLHVSRSMRRTLRNTPWTVTCGKALLEVMNGCADRPEGTWLNAEMKAAYLALGRLGHALSYEVWDGDELVGGLYGVLIGGLFAAESKFHRRTDASKVALCSAAVDLFDRGLQLFDVQFTTDHLKTMGIHEIPRNEYLTRLSSALDIELTAPEQEDNRLPRVRRILGLLP